MLLPCNLSVCLFIAELLKIVDAFPRNYRRKKAKKSIRFLRCKIFSVFEKILTAIMLSRFCTVFSGESVFKHYSKQILNFGVLICRVLQKKTCTGFCM